MGSLGGPRESDNINRIITTQTEYYLTIVESLDFCEMFQNTF
jgi:hypothetical protein